MQAADDDQELGVLIRREGVRHAVPAGLAERIRADLERAADTAHPLSVPGSPDAVPRRANAGRRWLQAIALFGAGAATAWGLALALLAAPADPTSGATPGALGDSITDAHLRSLMGPHLADVASTDQHTVKPWFAGKLDFSPPVVDLAGDGIPLTGGRLDYLAGHPVAALVYRAGPHVINLFIWPEQDAKTPTASPPTPPQALTRRGYNLVHWRQDGMQAWAVSDLNGAELQAFAALARQRISADRSPPANAPRQ
jgi:anti-sigma factor RsiW